jgi:hypothetical protein
MAGGHPGDAFLAELADQLEESALASSVRQYNRVESKHCLCARTGQFGVAAVLRNLTTGTNLPPLAQFELKRAAITVNRFYPADVCGNADITSLTTSAWR